MSWMVLALKHYADFSGRARRKEYWMFYLLNFIIGIVLWILEAVAIAAQSEGLLLFVGLLSGLIGLAVLIPSLAVLVRRLHDQDKSGAWFFILFIPFIGAIWMLVLMCTDGTPGPNQYGDDPKAAEAGGAGVAI